MNLLYVIGFSSLFRLVSYLIFGTVAYFVFRVFNSITKTTLAILLLANNPSSIRSLT